MEVSVDLFILLDAPLPPLLLRACISLTLIFASVSLTACLLTYPTQHGNKAQLCLSRGGLGLRSLSQHSAAAYVASFAVSGSATNTSHHLLQSIDCFNSLVSPADVTSTDELLTSPKNQKELSSRIEHSHSLSLRHCQIGHGYYQSHPLMLRRGFQLCHLLDSTYIWNMQSSKLQ